MIWLLLACGTNASEPVTGPAAQPVPVSQPTPPALRAAILTPASIYGACRERVEGEESPGECTADADCAKAGCSSEVCVPKAKAGEVMTACDVQDCFSVLDTCGCREGLCTWTLTAAGLARPLP